MRSRPLHCETHGRLPWRGTVICAPIHGGCGRAWNLVDGPHPDPEIDLCDCGQHLTKGEDATARAICAACYKARVEVPS